MKCSCAAFRRANKIILYSGTCSLSLSDFRWRWVSHRRRWVRCGGSRPSAGRGTHMQAIRIRIRTDWLLKTIVLFSWLPFVFHSHGSHGLPRIIRITNNISADQCNQWECKSVNLFLLFPRISRITRITKKISANQCYQWECKKCKLTSHSRVPLCRC